MKHLTIVGVDRKDNSTIVVEFSDGTFAVFTVEELTGVRTFRKSEPDDPALPN